MAPRHNGEELDTKAAKTSQRRREGEVRMSFGRSIMWAGQVLWRVLRVSICYVQKRETGEVTM